MQSAMERRLAFLGLLAIWCHQVSATVLDYSSDFNSRIADSDGTIVKFFTPSCGHCKAMKVDFEKASVFFKEGRFAEVDCSSSNGRDVCGQYDIRGYPTIKFFRGGKPVAEYDNDRSVDALREYVTKMTVETTTEITTFQQYTDAVDKADEIQSTVIGLFKEKHDDELLKTFKSAAEEHFVDYRFMFARSQEVIDQVDKTNKVLMFLPKPMRLTRVEPQPFVFADSLTVDGLVEFLQKNRYGKCGIRNHRNQKHFTDPIIVAYTQIDLEKNPSRVTYIRNRMILAAKQVHETYPDVTFTVSDVDSMHHELSKAGIEQATKTDIYLVGVDSQKRKFVLEPSSISVEVVKKFAIDMMSGQLEPYLRSEPAPVNQIGEDGVTVVVAKTFDEVIGKSDKDVFIEFYAPWCGHCKKLIPVFTELAKNYKDSNVMIAKLNAADNDVPEHLKVTGFPTLYFIPKNDKTHPIPYDGSGRTVSAITDFISQHQTSADAKEEL